MNYFEAQDSARKITSRLVFFFILAVLSLIVITNVMVMFVFGYFSPEKQISFDWETFWMVGVAITVVITFGSMYKTMILSAGGQVIAESLGGKLISANTSDHNLKKTLNVVEEMAIASGTPVPPVYLLEGETGINAFAAGFTPSDAVIGVTRGTVDQLNREELQGVIAHEFSHILNGDMRLNIRLMGILHGILLIGLIGYFILRSAAFSGRRRSSNDSKGSGGILGLAVGLMVIGFAGTFFGNIIKASVSRQREYLADASAVQFTRNPDGLAGALKKIGSKSIGSVLNNPTAPEVSHSFFAMGVSGFLTSLFSTHPPLDERIKKVDPQWDGKFPILQDSVNVEEDKVETGASKDRAKTFINTIATGVAIEAAVKNLNQAGQPNEQQLQYAQSLIQQIPPQLINAAHEPYGARAIIYSLILDKDASIRQQQMSTLKEFGDYGIYELTATLQLEIENLDAYIRLPLINISLPALREMSLAQFKLFRKNLILLIKMDSKIDLFEWTLQKILIKHLDAAFLTPKPSQSKYSGLQQLNKEIELLLSVLAYSGNTDKNKIKHAFAEATDQAKIKNINLLPKTEVALTKLDEALDKLNMLKPLLKQTLLNACLVCASADGKIVPIEMELMRAISDTLDCPMPILIPDS
ncbi:MAG: Zn-dependent protease with chaperone function [Gammaproteobacteria bacterium]|jgi:Zn-dependent protease with chaperone function